MEPEGLTARFRRNYQYLDDHVEGFIGRNHRLAIEESAFAALCERHHLLARLLQETRELITYCRGEVTEREQLLDYIKANALTGGRNYDAPPDGRSAEERRAKADIAFYQDPERLSVWQRMSYYRDKTGQLEALGGRIAADLQRVTLRLGAQPNL